jgi:hypothetical protein
LAAQLLVAGGSAGLGALFGRGGKDIDWGQFMRWLDTVQPEGYLTAEDRAAAEQTRSRLTAGANASTGNLRLEALRRIRQRGIETAPANEATLSRIDQIGAGGAQHAGDVAEEQLYNVRLGNKRFAQGKAMALIGGRLQDLTGGRARADARQSEFLNSLIGIAPSVMDAIDKHTGKPGGTKSYNASTGRIENVDVGGRNTTDYDPDPYED